MISTLAKASTTHAGYCLSGNCSKSSRKTSFNNKTATSCPRKPAASSIPAQTLAEHRPQSLKTGCGRSRAPAKIITRQNDNACALANHLTLPHPPHEPHHVADVVHLTTRGITCGKQMRRVNVGARSVNKLKQNPRGNSARINARTQTATSHTITATSHTITNTHRDKTRADRFLRCYSVEVCAGQRLAGAAKQRGGVSHRRARCDVGDFGAKNEHHATWRHAIHTHTRKPFT